MSFSWYFHSFNLQDLENKILKGHGFFSTDEEINKNNLEVIEKLHNSEFNYNKLEKKYWKYLDQYLTKSIIELPETEQVSPDHAHWRIWSEFANLEYAEPKIIFDALASEGSRYNFTQKKISFINNIILNYEKIIGKNRPDYIIIKDTELKIFINSLNKIFESTEEVVFKNFGSQEELKPYFLEPFLLANEKRKAILGILT